MSDEGVVDFVVVAFRHGGRWRVESVPRRLGNDLDATVTVLRERAGGDGFAFISVDEDFFVALRLAGADTRWLLSDVTAATDWPVARDVLDRLVLPLPDEDDRVQPAGDVTIFADLGVDPMSVAAICDDLDSYPDEMLARIADLAGFGPEFDDVLP
ncbi:putative tRNA adenosine deaminase-associated protein [Haloactinopolyspora alba]|uniref:Putative tRNA adenosine deaminase-associated protein n=1 Tax=Haloactinopolyspora alba TaxID=648780 RepID=A0A2P8E776_9ACTN|nr:tRNA adenosine deaminase-associated protein [Haloactinopolyspora alba]PSL05330.1 putative tRNA adenosine deaminase-associated protein [Haloactinopolyspora alba]